VVEITIDKLEGINHHILINFQQNSSSHDILKSTHLLIIFGIGMNCHSSGNNVIVPVYKKGNKTL
jgi:hypothetical protein